MATYSNRSYTELMGIMTEYERWYKIRLLIVKERGLKMTINEREQKGIDKFKQILKGRKNACYQFLVLEATLRSIEQCMPYHFVLLEDIFKQFAEFAYELHKNQGIDLGGDRQSVDGKTSANGIIDEFVNKYRLEGVTKLNEEQVSTLAKEIMKTNIRKWPIEGITNGKIGLFSKQNIEEKEYIVFDIQEGKGILKAIDVLRKENEIALNTYLKTIASNDIEDTVTLRHIERRPYTIPEYKQIDIDNKGRANQVKPKKIYQINELIHHIHAYIEAQGFSYSLQTIQNLYLALKTKPFTILAGISGIGKSKIIELFAEAIGATTENGRYKLIAVRPDWSDSTELVGYKDLNNQFNPGVLTQIIEKAIKDQAHPYFICLDEMNLARVEYYFSDFLSLIESRKWKDNNIVTHPLIEQKGYESLYIPENLYIIGTVNMDETTYPFSKKVLDRANTIEFSEVNLMDGLDEIEQIRPEKLVDVSNNYMKSEYLSLLDCKDLKEETRGVIQELIEVNQILEQGNLHFAYRVRDEIVFYMLYNMRFNLMSYEEAFEMQLLQKILPRITGSSSKIMNILEKLKVYTKERYPKAYEKVLFMIERYEEDGFTSYWM